MEQKRPAEVESIVLKVTSGKHKAYILYFMCIFYHDGGFHVS